MGGFTKWVAAWGNAISITDQTEKGYAKELTLRYPVKIVFAGDKLRIHFSNLTGKQDITINAVVAKAISDKEIDVSTATPVFKDGQKNMLIKAGQRIVTDEIPFKLNAGDVISVNIYLPDYTDMNSGVLTTGPLSKGFYSYGNYMNESELPLKLTRSTNWFYFMETIDVFTSEENRALVCYGDSITAQDWPEYLAIRAWEKGFKNVSIIRKAVSGTRILREYDCITYAAYGLKGEKRFANEVNVAGARDVIIQHGINDIIHPVGEEVNPFRPMSDLPTVDELIEGVKKLYIEKARELGLNVYAGTLLPIKGWRTYAPFRDDIKNAFNEWLRSSDLFDGCIDFDKAIQDTKDPMKFGEGFDSGDHLHPSALAYKTMAETVPEELLK